MLSTDVVNIRGGDSSTDIASMGNNPPIQTDKKVSYLAEKSFKFALFSKEYEFRANTHSLRIFVGGGVLSIGLWEVVKKGLSWPGIPLVLCGALEVYFSWRSYISEPIDTSLVQKLPLINGEVISPASERIVHSSDLDNEEAKRIVKEIVKMTSSHSEVQSYGIVEGLRKILEGWEKMRNAKLSRPGSSPKK